MKHINYVSVDTIISKLIRDLGVDAINEDDIIEWTAEALEAFSSVDLLEEAVAFIEVRNHQFELPKRIDSIIQIARKNNWSRQDESCTPCNMLNDLQDTLPESSSSCYIGGKCSSADDLVPLDCDGSPLFDTELVYYRPYYDFRAEYFDWRNSRYYKEKWTPVTLKNHTFFNSLVCPEESDGLYNNSKDEYSIVGNKVVRVSFQDGFVAVAYNRYLLDDDGYPMIPDTYSAKTAVTKYITYKISERNFYANRAGSESRLQKAESDWQWYCKQAGNEILMPKGVDQFENLLRQRNYLLPRNHRYNKFFANLSAPENRIFMNPRRM